MAQTPTTLRAARPAVFERLRRGASITRLIEGNPPYLETEPLQFIHVRYDGEQSRAVVR